MSIKPSKIALDFQYSFVNDPATGQVQVQNIQAVAEGITDTGTLIRLPLSKYCLETVLQMVSSDLGSDCGVVGANMGQALEETANVLWPAPAQKGGDDDDIPF